MKSAWVDFGCSESGDRLMAAFRNSGTGWDLTSVTDDGSNSGARGQVRITAPFGIAVDYPGCPSCGADSFVRCDNCGGIGCWKSTDTSFRCPACRRSGPVRIGIESVDALDTN